MKKSDITKQKILEAATEAFAEKGFYGARVDDIMQKAGVNKRMLYAYYENKENLYIAVLNRAYEQLSECEKTLLSEKLDPVNAVKRIIECDFEFLSSHPEFVNIILWENLNKAKYMKQSKAVSTKGISIDLLRKVFKQGIEQGVFRTDLDIEEMIVSVNMFCFSYFSNIYTMGYIMKTNFASEKEIEKRCEHISEMILKYIAL